MELGQENRKIQEDKERLYLIREDVKCGEIPTT
jgi:hypothetical protein